jgi:gluconolactonase
MDKLNEADHLWLVRSGLCRVNAAKAAMVNHMTSEIPIEQFSVFAANLDHPECLAFDRAGNLWAGGEAGQVYRIDREGRVTTVANLGSFCAGLAFSPDDELFVCVPALGIVRVTEDGKHSVFASHVGEEKLISVNYGLFDSAGNYYVTDSGNFQKRNGRLARFNRKAEGEWIAGPMGYTNGLALSADERTLFLVESDSDSVFRLRIAMGGSVGAPEIYARGCGRFPDGLALDADGNLYVCCYASDEIWRINPEGEKTLFAWDRWAIRLGSPTNMAFGGDNCDELFVANLARTTITRAKVGRRGQRLANQVERDLGARSNGARRSPSTTKQL